MITRKQLRKIPELYKQIERDKAQLQFLREKATSIQSSLADHERERTPGGKTLARDRVQTSRNNNVNKYIDEAIDLNKEIEKEETLLLDLQKKAKPFMDHVQDPLTRRVLKHRYLNCYNWDEIAELLGYEVSWLKKLEIEAVRMLDRK